MEVDDISFVVDVCVFMFCCEKATDSDGHLFQSPPF